MRSMQIWLPRQLCIEHRSMLKYASHFKYKLNCSRQASESHHRTGTETTTMQMLSAGETAVRPFRGLGQWSGETMHNTHCVLLPNRELIQIEDTGHYQGYKAALQKLNYFDRKACVFYNWAKKTPASAVHGEQPSIKAATISWRSQWHQCWKTIDINI